MGLRSSGLAQSASSFSIYSGTPAAIAPGVSVVGITRSLSAVISARCGGVNTGDEGGPALIGVTCIAAARAIGANRLATNIAALPASASMRSTDRNIVVMGKSVLVRVNFGGLGFVKKKIKTI